ncbi:Chitin deacetylase [Lachnellula occidentalis]|uniref:Chitin deacetylase n=1 Tax=Lachnellula occidentalis TaxID=215460 RepID=A0A8H8RUA6_9HELO|nr:Chitin deacetylase [Lachnellula occidentalis]
MVVSDPRYDIPRDLEGYGESSLNPKWPNNAKIALSFILNYEEGAERTVLNGDAHSEPYLWEKGASSSFLEGARHMAAESEYEYGSRVGAWRILRLFKEQGYRFTTWAVAQAAVKNPTFARALVRDGHEIAAHGARWLDISAMSVEEEKEYIRENCKVLEEVTGVFPRGFFYGRGTPNTRCLWPEVVKEMGGGKRLLYSSEAFNDDVPYWVDLPWEEGLAVEEREGLLIVPYNYDCNDGKFHMSPGFVGSHMYLDYLKSTFDMLLREGQTGSPKLMNIPMHSRIIGKPGRAEALRSFMLYVKEKGGDEVWVATREEIAEHFKKEFPYVPGHLAPGRKMGL